MEDGIYRILEIIIFICIWSLALELHIVGGNTRRAKFLKVLVILLLITCVSISVFAGFSDPRIDDEEKIWLVVGSMAGGAGISFLAYMFENI